MRHMRSRTVSLTFSFLYWRYIICYILGLIFLFCNSGVFVIKNKPSQKSKVQKTKNITPDFIVSGFIL